jgi:GNAT superfamily N-acetyltransferase
MTESTHQVIVSDKPNLAAARVISGGLSRYNREMAGYNDARKLSVLVCENGSDKVIGGLLGRTSLGMFFVDLFFLPKSHRGRGVGTRVIEYAEAEAKKRGCSTAVLYTITFQAPAFYERQGYQVLGHVECQPPGHTRLCMTKKF